MAQFKFTVPNEKEASTVKTAGSSQFKFVVPSGVPQPAITKKKKGTIGGVAKGVAKAIVEPVATMAARPVQLGAELLGASDESVNKFTKDTFGDWVAPTPQNAGDFYKDIGRGIQTALTAGLGSVAKSAMLGTVPKLGLTGLGALEGAGYGLGFSMEQGNDILSKETAINTGVGAVTAGVGAKVLSKFGKKATPKTNVPQSVTPNEAVTLTPKMSEGGTVPISKPKVEKPLGKGEVRIPPASEQRIGIKDTMVSLEQRGYSKGQQSAILGKVMAKYPDGNTSKLTRSEVANVANEMIPDFPPTVPSNAIIKARPPRQGVQSKLAGEVNTPKPTLPKEPIQPVEFVKQEAPKPTAISQIASNSAEQKIITDRVEKSVLSELDSVPGTKEFERQTNKEQTRIALSETIDRLEAVVFGKANPAKGSNRNAYLSVAFNLADEMARKGDTYLANKLVSSGIKRNLTGGVAQQLQATQIIGKSNVTNLLAKLQQEMIEKMPSFRKGTREAEILKMKTQLKELLKDSTMTKMTKQQFKEIYNSIICK